MTLKQFSICKSCKNTFEKCKNLKKKIGFLGDLSHKIFKIHELLLGPGPGRAFDGPGRARALAKYLRPGRTRARAYRPGRTLHVRPCSNSATLQYTQLGTSIGLRCRRSLSFLAGSTRKKIGKLPYSLK